MSLRLSEFMSLHFPYPFLPFFSHPVGPFHPLDPQSFPSSTSNHTKAVPGVSLIIQVRGNDIQYNLPWQDSGKEAWSRRMVLIVGSLVQRVKYRMESCSYRPCNEGICTLKVSRVLRISR